MSASPSTIFPTQKLAQSQLFQCHTEALPLEERLALSYKRAQAIGRAYCLTPKDLLMLSPKFWQLHIDPIWSMDGAAGTLCTLQYNCCAGTIATFLAKRPSAYLAEILGQVLAFEISGQFCLTEVGHGLDAIHLETTATLQPDGTFELHTPSERAAKYMPPTSPVAGIPCVAVVFARMMVDCEDYGVKPFVVELHDGYEMSPGVTSKLLPQRGGSRPLNHALTYFNRVTLPPDALLGSPAKPKDARAAFFASISRVAVGTIAIGSLGVPALRVSSYIAARYSARRTVVDAEGKRKPIISFRTQKVPIITALAQSFVMQAMQEHLVPNFCDVTLDPRVRHAIASILKVTMITHAQAAHLTLSDRCGAQGLFEVNQLSGMFADMRGTAIAEGDLLGISIRLATELLLGRYAVPSTKDAASLLARHEAGLFEDLRGRLAEAGHHRTDTFDRMVLPELFGLVQAVGHRMAYDAAVANGVETSLIDLYVASCVKMDAVWYVENAGMTRRSISDMESAAVDAIFPRMEELLAQTGVEPYISAPIVSDETWVEYVASLPTFSPADARPEKDKLNFDSDSESDSKSDSKSDVCVKLSGDSHTSRSRGILDWVRNLVPSVLGS